MKHPIQIFKACKLGSDKGSFCSACYEGWGLIFNGETVKVDKCGYCN